MQINLKVINGMKTWKGKGKTTTLLFFLKELGILQYERRRQVNTTVMERFNSILFHKSAPANKQHINQSINTLSFKSIVYFHIISFNSYCYSVPASYSRNLNYCALNSYLKRRTVKIFDLCIDWRSPSIMRNVCSY